MPKPVGWQADRSPRLRIFRSAKKVFCPTEMIVRSKAPAERRTRPSRRRLGGQAHRTSPDYVLASPAEPRDLAWTWSGKWAVVGQPSPSSPALQTTLRESLIQREPMALLGTSHSRRTSIRLRCRLRANWEA